MTNKTDPVEDNSVEPTIEDLQAKIADQSRHLTGSKAEALRIKKENAELQTQIDELKSPESPQVNDEDLKYVGQLLDKAGYAKKTDIEASEKKSDEKQQKKESDKILKNFIKKYPEYKPENDPADKKWNALVKELKRYKDPTKNLEKAHKDINPDNSLEKGRSLGHAEANLGAQAQIGGSSSGSTSKSKRTPDQQAIMDELLKRRPEYKEK